MHCLVCSTEQVRKFSIVYEEGTSRGSSEGSSNHPRDKAIYTAEHFSQTALAARCSPPHEPDVGFVLGSIGIVLSVGAGIQLGKATTSLWWGTGCFLSSSGRSTLSGGCCWQIAHSPGTRRLTGAGSSRGCA
ncbi:hypothetical protein [Massilia sp. MS-15]|uniref:hypothetical protein n=1 Tax=Massilia sp. MS-15 TaxID=2878200 RepID=UPI001CD34F1F|nr:hypothetical protein [Massilia sp. MS-15]MCA1248698.1 hypothetical protein [Massilia sp. MS-15]